MERTLSLVTTARWTRLRSRLTNEVHRSAVRFAAAMLIVDLVVLAVFRSGEALAMGSFAVIVLLYFLDYDGSAHERLVGFSTAIGVGLVAISVGTILSTSTWAAVIGAFVVSGIFGYVRVLRGYVARAAVGLQCAFFLPLMADSTLDDLPSLLAAWLVGGAVAIGAGMLILPKYRDGVLRAALSRWLKAAGSLAEALSTDRDLEPALASLRAAAEPLISGASGPRMRPGAIGPRQRALAELVDVVRWSGPIIGQLEPFPAGRQHELARQSGAAFIAAAETVVGNPPESSIPDLPALRAADLNRLADAEPSDVRGHYSARLISILAMWMLWLAGRSQGIVYPTPDIGSLVEERPWPLIKAHLRIDSPWLRNALRTGGCGAACVVLVRLLGLEHGVWVVLAALCVTQVSFSGLANGASAIRMVAGATAGILIASIGLILDLPQIGDIVVLPFMAFLAVVGAAIGPMTAQMLFTPFVLVNFAALEWATQRGLEIVRLEDVAIGAAVAAGFAFLTFPFGLAKELRAKVQVATSAAAGYLAAAVAAASGTPRDVAGPSRQTCVTALVRLEATIDAAGISGDVSQEDMSTAIHANAVARDQLVGGDACTSLAHAKARDARIAPISALFAAWWSEHLLKPATDR